MELYHKPANQFVAGFIGSPKMNFIPAAQVSGIELKGAATVGVRPEHLLVATDGPLKGVVRTVENLGSVSYAYAALPDETLGDGGAAARSHARGRPACCHGDRPRPVLSVRRRRQGDHLIRPVISAAGPPASPHIPPCDRQWRWPCPAWSASPGAAECSCGSGALAVAMAVVEGGVSREEFELVIGQMVVDPPGHCFPAAGALVPGQQRVDDDGGARAHLRPWPCGGPRCDRRNCSHCSRN